MFELVDNFCENLSVSFRLPGDGSDFTFRVLWRVGFLRSHRFRHGLLDMSGFILLSTTPVQFWRSDFFCLSYFLARTSFG